jgi:ditrans,polycis-polyprenyl diphosphate synthase
VIDGVESRLISIELLKQYKVIDVGKLRYLAIVVDSEEARRISKVIRLLKWLHHIGVKRVCLYDTEGELKGSKDAILQKLSYVKPFEDPSDFAENKMIVEFLSQSDGKEAVARAANLLLKQQLKLRKSGEDKEDKLYTESQLTEALKAVGCKGPDPDLLLVYGSARCHLGFPAWRLRYTEIVHMGSLKFMRYGALQKAIYKFTLVRQNYGK